MECEPEIQFPRCQIHETRIHPCLKAWGQENFLRVGAMQHAPSYRFETRFRVATQQIKVAFHISISFSSLKTIQKQWNSANENYCFCFPRSNL